VRASRSRPAGLVRLALPALVVLLGVAGFLVARATIDRDRDAAADRRAQVASVRIQGLLGEARSYVIGLSTVLAGEPVRRQSRFTELVASAAGGVGLEDSLWVEPVAGGDRRAYERRLGAPIVRPLPDGGFVPAPAKTSYLPATFTSRTRRDLRPGVDVSYWPALATQIGDQASVFAVGASLPGSLGQRRGFYVVEAVRFGAGAHSSGVLAVFVPRGWLTVGTQDDPRGLEIALDGQPVEGQLDEQPAASASFRALGRRWHVDVAQAEPSGLQSILPWILLVAPGLIALGALLVVRAVGRRRRAERELERIFDMSLDLVGVSRFDGTLTRLNPAFGRILGYSEQEMLGRHILEFVHPDDRESTRAEIGAMARDGTTVTFECRHVCRDGSHRWIQWKARPFAEERMLFGVGRDVTEEHQLTEEQAALRRVATLVARGARQEEVFAAVVREIRQLFGVDAAVLRRLDPGRGAVTVARDGDGDGAGPALESPVIVEGRVWGAVGLVTQQGPLPGDTDARMAKFTELVATAIANAESRAEVAASRARIVAASDETRRRIERDLHDGTQQRLVSLALELRAAEDQVPPELDQLRAELSATAAGLAQAVEDLREISRGIHPAILSEGGLRPALRTLARRSAVPVDLQVEADGRLPEPTEAAAYFLVSEALANAAKHSGASTVHVRLDATGPTVEIEISDDGAGGADPARGSGLTGLRDRVEALGGTFQIVSEPGAGTTLNASVPVEQGPGQR
jgi:PAS domain S-box-containing protein